MTEEKSLEFEASIEEKKIESHFHGDFSCLLASGLCPSITIFVVIMHFNWLDDSVAHYDDIIYVDVSLFLHKSLQS